jgi:processive 1,2-diacylglycerol beta-glucosyltransferase
VTDYDIHALWVNEHMTGYFAASEEIAVRMVHRGIPENIIHITGIPIMPVFSKSFSKKKAKEKLNIPENRPVVLLMAGGLGVGGILELTNTLLEINQEFTIIALAGKNKELYNSLQKKAVNCPDKLIPMGFTETIEELMASADIAVTKPGGLTTSECLAMKLPMIVVSPIPGQEERNADFLLEAGAAVKACDEATAKYKLEKLLNNPEKLKSMAENAEKVSSPSAGEKVLKTMLEYQSKLNQLGAL